MDISKEELFQAVEGIFNSMLGLPVACTHRSVLSGGPASIHGMRVTSSVSLTGGWSGSILIECSGETACTLASALLKTECRQVDDNVKDVLGELANMVAGNVTRRLPGSTQLSLPSVVTGSRYTVDVLRGQKMVQLPLCCNDRNLNVSVIKASAR
ncbi:MAG TPA: chemotaxis protein CheX [Acidobacteriota bacterium]|nr:chemotaxis protein CheX [Acidobacteriota bacterium]